MEKMTVKVASGKNLPYQKLPAIWVISSSLYFSDCYGFRQKQVRANIGVTDAGGHRNT